MYTVYKITNKINGKSYVGSSVRLEKRWKDHINTSKNPNNPHYNYPLYQAFRKYGIDNFNFEILNDNFESLEEMWNYEKEAILQYECLKNGYNQTLNTIPNEMAKENTKKCCEKRKQRCAKIDINNNILETYESYHDAARKNGFDGEQNASMIRNICKGKNSSYKGMLFFRDLDENNQIIERPFKSYKNKKQIIGIKIDNPIEEIYFNSISEAALFLNSDRRSIGLCLQGSDRYSQIKGYILREIDSLGNIIDNVPDKTIEKRIENFNRTNPMINGERHNIKEWCEIYGISPTSYYLRIKKGMGVIEALTTPKRR